MQRTVTRSPTPTEPCDVPEAVRRLREEARAANEARDLELVELARRRRRQDAVEGLLLFLVADFAVVDGIGWLVFPVLAGALVGWLWSVLDLGSIGVGLLAASVHAAVWIGPLSGQADSVVAFLFGTAFVALLGSYLGTRRELRIFD